MEFFPSLFTNFNNTSKVSELSYLWQKELNYKDTFFNDFRFYLKNNSFGNHSLGYEYLHEKLNNSKNSNNIDFSNPKISNYLNQHSLKYDFSYFWQKMVFLVGLKKTIVEYPSSLNTTIKSNYNQYNISIGYDYDNYTNLSITLNKQLASFPIHKLTTSNNLMDFQIIQEPYKTNITPYYNSNIILAFNKYSPEQVHVS
ncbi:hypothetical protein AS361_00705 [Myroides marinus]|uniref:hypothetical protein n=1 Tax=Myroides marinus TaxID=703342 RepID=UPI000741ED4C|nr:hypothetical protein [Myroides marinus]KUF39726.1 hypothetical protein AS361_00705 [Myroides marinus]